MLLSTSDRQKTGQLTGAGRHLVDEVLGPRPEVITAAVVAPAPHAAAVRPRRLGAAAGLHLRLVHDHGHEHGEEGEELLQRRSLHWPLLATMYFSGLRGCGGLQTASEDKFDLSTPLRRG